MDKAYILTTKIDKLEWQYREFNDFAEPFYDVGNYR
jgi:hypothetical protein